MDAIASSPHLKFYFCRWGQIFLMCLVAVVCVFEIFMLVMSYNPVNHVPLSSKQCGIDHLRFSVDLTNASSLEKLENNGELGQNSSQMHNEISSNLDNILNTSFEVGNVIYPPGHFFQHNGSLKGCSCTLKTCIVKCCPFGQRFDSRKNLTCTLEKSASPLIPYKNSVFSKLNHQGRILDLRTKEMNQSDLFVIVGEKCDPHSGEYGFRYDIKKSFLIEDGTVLTNQLIYLDLNKYCMDGVAGSEEIITVTCVRNTLPFVIRRSVTGTYYKVIITVWALSIVSLLGTIKVYCHLSELQNLHGKLVICYLICLSIYFTSSLLREFLYNSVTILTVLNRLLQFSFLGWFLWLTMICYNMWWVFSHPLRHLSPSLRIAQRQFLWYSVFGWGIPASACALTIIVGVVPNIPNADSCDKPRFEDDPCFFDQKRTTQLFQYYLLVLLFLLNFVMFLSTICNLRCLHFQNSNCLSPTSNQNAKEGIFLYLKLSLSMGLNNIFPMVFYFFNTPLMFFFGRIIESSIGIVLFIVLILGNKRVRERLQEKFFNNNSFVLTSYFSNLTSRNVSDDN